jgi:hypothetical protein
MAEREDILQELCVFCIENKLNTPDESLEDDEYNAASQTLRRALRKAGDRFCRQEKALSSGYDVEDEAFYSVDRLRELVETFYSDGLTEHPPIGRTESVRHTGDGSEAGTWLSSLIDVERGLSLLSPEYSHRLSDRYKTNAHMSDSDYGYAHGLTEDQVRGRTRSALRALQRHLGGSNPWNRGPTPHSQADQA